MSNNLPHWLEIGPERELTETANEQKVTAALSARTPGQRELAVMLSDTAGNFLDVMIQRAQTLTRCHFGRTISLYVPLYLSNYCSGGCAYCGFASDREQPRLKLSPDELNAETRALKEKGFQDVLLLTGDRIKDADFGYLLDCVSVAAKHFHNISIESFSMTSREYEQLVMAGCTGLTLYQETYDPILYAQLHRWGPKRDYQFRLESPERALSAGMRTAGLGVLLGLNDPVSDLLHLFRHAEYLRKKCWQAGVMISFPRICAQRGDYQPSCPVNDRFLTQIICAFRICMPDVPLVLSTRERPAFRDAIAGIGISKMSVASRTTVGGYCHATTTSTGGQFEVNDTRDVGEFCDTLRNKKLEPVFKNWDSVFRGI